MRLFMPATVLTIVPLLGGCGAGRVPLEVAPAERPEPRVEAPREGRPASRVARPLEYPLNDRLRAFLVGRDEAVREYREAMDALADPDLGPREREHNFRRLLLAAQALQVMAKNMKVAEGEHERRGLVPKATGEGGAFAPPRPPSSETSILGWRAGKESCRRGIERLRLSLADPKLTDDAAKRIETDIAELDARIDKMVDEIEKEEARWGGR